jgi:putative ABC transport system substrate-binding protein
VAGLLGAALALPLLAARATARRPFRIGFASGLDPRARKAFADLMTGRKWQHDKDYVFLSPELAYGFRMEESVRQILKLDPDLLVVASTAYAIEARRHSKTLPVVMYSSGYPVAAGLAQSLARPGGNVTGNTVYAGAKIWGKLFQLLAEAKPATKRIGLLWSYPPPHFPAAEHEFAMADLREDARALGVEPVVADVADLAGVPRALAAIAAGRPDAVVLTNGPGIWLEIPKLLRHFAEKRWPSISDAVGAITNLDPGPLLAYGPTGEDLRRQTVDYIDRIMRGAKPGELPIQMPKNYELTVNRKTAGAIGLSLPRSLLVKADRVVD